MRVNPIKAFHAKLFGSESMFCIFIRPGWIMSARAEKKFLVSAQNLAIRRFHGGGKVEDENVNEGGHVLLGPIARASRETIISSRRYGCRRKCRAGLKVACRNFPRAVGKAIKRWWFPKCKLPLEQQSPKTLIVSGNFSAERGTSWEVYLKTVREKCRHFKEQLYC